MLSTPRFVLALACALAPALLLSGCALQETALPTATAGLALSGTVHGGQQAVTGAHIYLIQATVSGTSSTGYGNTATPIALTTFDGSDATGKYVLTTANGAFSLTGKYTCTPNAQVYILATGGNPGLPNGTNNASLALMAALGNCPAAGTFAVALPTVSINEVTTVAAAYALSGFMTGATTISASTTGATALANAFSATTNLVNLPTGAALSTTPSGNGTVPSTLINTLANVIAACINSDGTVVGPTNPTNCYTLFNTVPGTVPTDTIGALLNIIHNPSTNVTNTFNLAATNAPFQPSLNTAPNDWGLAITYAINSNTTYYNKLETDSTGSIYLADGNVTTYKVSPLGVSTATFTSAVENNVITPFLDPATLNLYTRSGNAVPLQVYNPAGTALGGTSGYLLTGGYTAGIAFDGATSAYTINTGGQLAKINTGNAPSVATNPFSVTGLNAGGSNAGIALTSGGNIWVQSYTAVAHGTTSAYTSTAAVTGNGLGGSNQPVTGVMVDASQNVYVLNTSFGSMTPNKLSGWTESGTILTGSPFTLTPTVALGYGAVVDGANTLWANGSSKLGRISLASPASAALALLTPATNLGNRCTIDISGNIWCAISSGLLEYVGMAAPTAQPLSPSNHGIKP